jgi:two-component system, chemotaxis family, protein-glutamate methylesterase/glutaminase
VSAVQAREAVRRSEPGAVVIGASAGAIAALGQILPPLPADYPLPLLVVVHLPAERPSSLCRIFAESCRLRIREAEDKLPIEPGTAYFAAPDYHMLVDRGPVIALSVDPPVHFSRPAIDVLFESAAMAYGSRLTGIVLTGTSADGAHGLAAIQGAGGRALVQSAESAEWSFMPDAAQKACPRAQVLDLPGIRDHLLGLAVDASGSDVAGESL